MLGKCRKELDGAIFTLCTLSFLHRIHAVFRNPVYDILQFLALQHLFQLSTLCWGDAVFIVTLSFNGIASFNGIEQGLHVVYDIMNTLDGIFDALYIVLTLAKALRRSSYQSSKLVGIFLQAIIVIV